MAGVVLLHTVSGEVAYGAERLGGEIYILAALVGAVDDTELLVHGHRVAAVL